MEYFCQEAVSSKKSQLVLKIRILLLFVMLESWLIWQIGCRICLWFQHNGEVINRIMDSKQGGSHVCFFLGGFQISQTECNAVFLSCGRKDQLAANSQTLQRKRKAAPITGCEKLTFQNSRFKQPMGFVQLREGKCNPCCPVVFERASCALHWRNAWSVLKGKIGKRGQECDRVDIK